MDKKYLLKAAAYVEFNPVKAKMVKRPEDYRWSSVHAHLKGTDPSGITDPGKLLELCGDWKLYQSKTRKNRMNNLTAIRERVDHRVTRPL